METFLTNIVLLTHYMLDNLPFNSKLFIFLLARIY